VAEQRVGASDMQAARQMGHGKIETTKNIYGHLFAQDRASIAYYWDLRGRECKWLSESSRRWPDRK
jgi:hypothetical protein